MKLASFGRTLLDRVFQPLADRLDVGFGWSCFRVAKALLWPSLCGLTTAYILISYRWLATTPPSRSGNAMVHVAMPSFTILGTCVLILVFLGRLAEVERRASVSDAVAVIPRLRTPWCLRNAGLCLIVSCALDVAMPTCDALLPSAPGQGGTNALMTACIVLSTSFAPAIMFASCEWRRLHRRRDPAPRRVPAQGTA